jgi:L-ectoine synthase
MLIRKLDWMEAQSDRLLKINQGKSSALRMLNASDGLGFSLSEARGAPGGNATLWYKNHWEANYIRQGSGTLEDLTTGQVWNLKPGVLYCVGPKDRHRLQNDGGDGFRMISIFNPPLTGSESHDAEGTYAASGTPPGGQERMFVKTWKMAEDAGHAVSRAGGGSRFAKLLTTPDNLGFAISDVWFTAGREADLWYRNHWEANIVLDGEVEITDTATGTVHKLGTGDVYCMGPRDKHHLRVLADSHVISVFNPPLDGTERHDDEGGYPPTGPIPEGPDTNA